jgi:ATP-binding protein involved in chromosome partitioning
VRRIRTYADLQGPDRSGLGRQVEAQNERVACRLEGIRTVLAVTSGKGGVGKSLVAATLASALVRRGLRGGLLDADLNGPSAPAFLGLSRPTLEVTDDGVVPPSDALGLRVMSTDLLMDERAPLRWREPRTEGHVWRSLLERGVFREFLSDVVWGRLDVLVVDLPPGPQRLAELKELAPDRTRVLGVTIPTSASRTAVERSLRLAVEGGLLLLGLVENMAGYACPACGEVGPLHPGEAGESIARALGTPLLGRIPFDAEAAACAERGDMEGLLSSRAGREIGRLAGVVAEGLGL